MIDVLHTKCSFSRCTTESSYGVDGGRAEVCSKHAGQGVVSTSRVRQFYLKHAKDGMVNVASKRCGHPGCTKI